MLSLSDILSWWPEEKLLEQGAMSVQVQARECVCSFLVGGNASSDVDWAESLLAYIPSH